MFPAAVQAMAQFIAIGTEACTRSPPVIQVGAGPTLKDQGIADYDTSLIQEDLASLNRNATTRPSVLH